MFGIHLNRPIVYENASLRFFKNKEYHVSRLCKSDVLLMVYDGVLRFSEDGTLYEIHPGQYHIQRHDSVQEGMLPSDAPKYLYVHFHADWTDDADSLPRSGCFEYARLKSMMEALDHMSHSDSLYVTQAGLFYQLLSELHRTQPVNSIASQIAEYIAKTYQLPFHLEDLCDTFHFSKNHVIHLFKQEFGITPVTYVNLIRLQRAAYLMEVTSDSLEQIAAQCGFQNYSHFYRQFIRKHACSPKDWRAQKRIGSCSYSGCRNNSGDFAQCAV